MRSPETQSENFQIESLEALDQAVRSIRQRMTQRCVVLMSGPLGSGKTKTVETFLRQMGFAGSSSPTFALHQVYETKPVSIDHFDLYRIESEDELAGAGVYEVFEKPSGLVFIEWAERLGDLENFFVPDWQIIHFEFYFENGLRQLKMRFNLGR